MIIAKLNRNKHGMNLYIQNGLKTQICEAVSKRWHNTLLMGNTKHC